MDKMFLQPILMIYSKTIHNILTGRYHAKQNILKINPSNGKINKKIIPNLKILNKINCVNREH